MLFRKYFAILCLIIFHVTDLNCLRSFNIRWRRVTCIILSKNHVGMFNCTLKELPRNRGNYATALIQFSQTIENVLLDFKVTMPALNNKEMDLIKFRSDGCRMSKHQSANPIIAAMAKQLFQSANFSDSCPLEANVTYAVDNLSLNPDYFPGFTPEMNFTLKFHMLSEKMHLLSTSMVGSVIKKK